jgi:hypothetical protein
VGPGREISTPYFLCSGGTGTYSIESESGHVTPNLCFCIGGGRGGVAGHVVHSGVPGPRNVDALFVILGWDRYGFYRKCVGPRYSELVFLHQVGSVGHVVHSGASGV